MGGRPSGKIASPALVTASNRKETFVDHTLILPVLVPLVQMVLLVVQLYLALLQVREHRRNRRR